MSKWTLITVTKTLVGTYGGELRCEGCGRRLEVGGSWPGATAGDQPRNRNITVRQATKNSGSEEAKKVKVNEDNPVGCLYYILLNEPSCQMRGGKCLCGTEKEAGKRCGD